MSGLRTGLWSATLSVLVLAAAGAVGIALKQPWLFPSLGPTLMVVAETPREPAAHPRNVLVGHLVGLGAGLIGLLLTGLRSHPSAVQEGLTGYRLVVRLRNSKVCFGYADSDRAGVAGDRGTAG